jgi:hypothetical protein
MPLFYPHATNSLLPLVMEGQAPLNISDVNNFYDVCRVRQHTGLFNWVTGAKYAYLLSPDYVFDALHDMVANIAPVARIDMAPINNRSVNEFGWCCSVAIEFFEVDPIPSLEQAYAVVFAEGDAEDSPLICYFTQILEMPFTPDGRSWYLYPNSSQSGGVAGSGGWFT